eukprot:1653326-Pyramimonas_sp.AAC.1
MSAQRQRDIEKEQRGAEEFDEEDVLREEAQGRRGPVDAPSLTIVDLRIPASNLSSRGTLDKNAKLVG